MFRLAGSLLKSSLSHIEVGAFVSPKWVPQMKSSEVLVKKSLKYQKDKTVHYSALVPNVRGMEDALKSGIKEVAIFGASSETFSKNLSKSSNHVIAPTVTKI